MIYITGTLRIRKLDEHNLLLEQYLETKSKKQNNEIFMGWKSLGYFGSLKLALLAAFKKQLFDIAEEDISIKDIVDRIEDAEKNIQASKSRINATDNLLASHEYVVENANDEFRNREEKSYRKFIKIIEDTENRNFEADVERALQHAGLDDNDTVLKDNIPQINIE